MTLDLPDPEDDGLLIPVVKSHSRSKHHFLRRYLHAFTVSMPDKWGELHYIDLFAGAGIERIESSGLEWGSPLIAVQMPKPFSGIHLCEKSRDKYIALESRLALSKSKVNVCLYNGDANLECKNMIRHIPSNSLTVAFLDPYGLHLNFKTVRTLSLLKIDLIIFFPDRIDALRNWSAYYLGNEQSNLDQFMGRSDWRDPLTESNPDRHPEILQNLCEEQLKTLRFNKFDYRRIYSADGRPLYRLIFCSRHERGLEIWRNVCKKEPGEQYGLSWN